MLAQNVTGNEQQTRKASNDQQEGKPAGIFPKNSRQQQEPQSILNQRAEALQHDHWLGEGINGSPVQQVVGIGVVVESRIHAKSLDVNQAMDLILYPLGLSRSDPGERAGQKLPHDPEGCDSGSRKRNRCPTMRSHESVEQSSEKKRLTGWNERLSNHSVAHAIVHLRALLQTRVSARTPVGNWQTKSLNCRINMEERTGACFRPQPL